MNLIDEYVVDALRVSLVHAEQLADDVAERLRASIVAKFSRPGRRCLWETLVERVSVQIENPLPWLSTFIDERSCLLFFDTHDSRSVYRFRSGTDLVSMLNAAYGFVYYVADDAGNYVFAFNDHDYLIACGSAMPWLRARLESSEGR